MRLVPYSIHLTTCSVASASQAVLNASLASTLSRLLVPQLSSSQERLVARYANRFRLAFSLLNEDAAAGDLVLSWDLESAIKRESHLAT